MISILYNGGGTTNALQVAIDLNAIIALGTQPTAIATGNHTGIELFLSGIDDDRSPVVVAINHSSTPISLTNIIHIQEDVVSVADMAFIVDRAVWGLVAAVDHEPKRLVYFPCAPDSYVSIVLQSVDTTTWYTRYRLTQMHTAARGGVGAAEGDAATEAKQDNIISALGNLIAGYPTEAVAGSGAKLDADLSSAKERTGLTAETTYRWTSIDGVVMVGVADVGAGGATAANVLWTIPAGNTEYITLPTGITSLFYSALTEDVTVYTSEMA